MLMEWLGDTNIPFSPLETRKLSHMGVGPKDVKSMRILFVRIISNAYTFEYCS